MNNNFILQVVLFVVIASSLTMAKPTSEIESLEPIKSQSESSAIARDKRGLLLGAAYTAPVAYTSAYTAPVAYTSAYSYSPYAAYSAYSAYPYYAGAYSAPYYLA